jgi:hypothetical protein
MKRNPIYLRSKFSDKELALLKLDLINNSVYFVSKIKNLNLDRNIIEELVKNTVEQVINAYKFGQDGSLGDLVKTSVIANLRAYYENAYPDLTNKILWPDLDKRATFIKLLDVLSKLEFLKKGVTEGIFATVNETLNERQQKMLSTIYRNPNLTYAEISKLYGNRGVLTYRELRIIYNQLIQILKNLGVIL